MTNEFAGPNRLVFFEATTADGLKEQYQEWCDALPAEVNIKDIDVSLAPVANRIAPPEGLYGGGSQMASTVIMVIKFKLEPAS